MRALALGEAEHERAGLDLQHDGAREAGAIDPGRQLEAAGNEVAGEVVDRAGAGGDVAEAIDTALEAAANAMSAKAAMLERKDFMGVLRWLKCGSHHLLAALSWLQSLLGVETETP
ncbi:hypothetical protein A3K87_05050 [Variovorax paradoxus]|uniref:Uncharacterized protein n=1 Tax=Variovorax paradoxus TaxID=34073 RepID=A0AA91ID83_VARPD|nr:hypothetical protein [Variovorax paradoxus]OAK66914.1 hypothetical protein A3K87_05050 [Variovorax paradoxus]